MNFINEIVAKSSLVDTLNKQLNKLAESAICPKGYLLTPHYHRETVSFSIHKNSVHVEVNPLLSIIHYAGVTRVSAYILVQEFKSLNS